VTTQISLPSLAGKVAFVTGVGSGIGRATARLLAQAGARIGGLTRTMKDAQATCRDIQRAGGEALPLAGDVSDAAAIKNAIRRIDRKWGRLDLVVANAGINGVWAPLEDLTEREWDETFDVNLKGTFLTVRHALPLLKRHGGSIILVASVNGTRMFSNTGATAYASSKAAQVAFGRMMALELARHGIRVNTVCPGAIDTRIDDHMKRRNLRRIQPAVIFPRGTVPLTNGRPGTAEQVAQLVWFLASDFASHITGTEVYIDGAQSLLQG
jgi:NAD(P)-dependent dehydrogenase (short-subunit alcohol dehydrogenase family)